MAADSGFDTSQDIRSDWTKPEVEALFALPFNDLLFRAHSLHRRYHQPNRVQLSTLLSIKTGACPEDCAYCPQSVRFETGLKQEPLMQIDAVLIFQLQPWNDVAVMLKDRECDGVPRGKHPALE